MTDFSIVHEFDTDAETFWRVFFDEHHAAAFYGSIGVVRTELRRDEDDDSLVVIARYSSERQLPGFVRKILGNRELGYVETLTYRKREGYAAQHVEPSIAAERTRFSGRIAVEPVAAGRIRRRYDGRLSIAIPLVGGRIERATIDDMTRAHQRAAEVTRAWLADAGPGSREPATSVS